jgi:hypothetical protein
MQVIAHEPFLHESSVVRADRLWRVRGAVRCHRPDVA